VLGGRGSDALTGSSGADFLSATGNGADANANILNGLGGNDTLNGAAGDDMLTGGEGSDVLNGGGGTDTATYSADATIARLPNGKWSVTDAGGTDTLSGIERVVIGNKTYLLVDKAGAGTGGYQSIQAAVDAAAGGETILIAPGSYVETEEYVPGNFHGMYINKPNLTLQGVKADGSLITTAADAREFGATVISGAQNMFGANHWIDADGDGTVLQGLHLQAGEATGNKLLEIWADNVTVKANFIDTLIGGDVTNPSWAAAVYLNEVANQPINSYKIEGNILNEGIYVANGVGDGASGDISAAQQIIGNHFETSGFDASDPDTLGRYDMVAVQGRIPGLGYQDDSAQVPTISGNTRSDNSAPFIFRMTEESAALFPSLAELKAIVANNTDANSTYAYVIDKDTGEAKLVQSGGINRLLVANGIDTLNAFLDETADAVAGGKRLTMETGDTLVVQSGAAAVDSQIMVDDLTILATADSADLNLTLATELADGTDIAGGGVQRVTLADHSTGQGADVDVTGNDLANTIIGNSGANRLDGAGGNDALTGGAGDDSLTGGAGTDTALYAGTVAVNRTTDGWTVTDGADMDTLSGVEIVNDSANGKILLVGSGGFATIQEAIDAASDGDLIMLAAGNYVGNVNLNKAVTIEGANAGVAGAGTRGAESVIQGTINVSAGAVVDGVRILNATNNATYYEGIRVTGTNDFTVKNSVFFRTASIRTTVSASAAIARSTWIPPPVARSCSRTI
jgi:hypothetical protein